MNLIQRGESQLLDSGSLGLGQLHIGASDTICRYFLVPYLKQFHKKFPNVPIKVTNATSLSCVDLLDQGKVDLIVTNFPNSNLNHSYIQKTAAILPTYSLQTRHILTWNSRRSRLRNWNSTNPHARPQKYDEPVPAQPVFTASAWADPADRT